jgi:Flp pilus assembly protein TadG
MTSCRARRRWIGWRPRRETSRGFDAAIARLRRSTHGGVALMAAVLIPVLIFAGMGAVELNQVLSDKQKTQDVADAAALLGAQQLNVAPVGADSRTQAFALAQLDTVASHADVTVTATVVDQGTMKVAIDTHRDSFFINLFPPGGFFTHAEATATGASLTPLCVLITGPGASDHIHVTGQATISAPACLAHSNHAVFVDNGAADNAAATEAGTTASGNIQPAAKVGAPPVQDPFASLSIGAMCLNGVFQKTYTSSQTIAAQDFCGGLTVKNGATLTLGPGVYNFGDDLDIEEAGSLNGSAGVVLIFHNGAKIDWGHASKVDLNGAKSGPYAGLVVIADRFYTQDFHIQSDPITNITGTIYVPNAKLVVDGSGGAGNVSAWTVLASKAFDLTGAQTLTINANYMGTDVPVPQGVGNRRTGNRPYQLIQ